MKRLLNSSKKRANSKQFLPTWPRSMATLKLRLNSLQFVTLPFWWVVQTTSNIFSSTKRSKDSKYQMVIFKDNQKAKKIKNSFFRSQIETIVSPTFAFQVCSKQDCNCGRGKRNGLHCNAILDWKWLELSSDQESRGREEMGIEEKNCWRTTLRTCWNQKSLLWPKGQVSKVSNDSWLKNGKNSEKRAGGKNKIK